MQSLSLNEAAEKNIDAVVIGASAGGVEALMKLFTALPATYPIPIVAVLHLPEGHDSQLAQIFNYRVGLSVTEARDKESIKPAMIYFAPPGYHLSIEADLSFSLSGEDPVHYSRPSIDILMESAADAYATRVAGVLLTGANFDGAAGLAQIKARGGIAIVQNPAESQVPTMPMAAINRQAVHLVLSLDEIHNLFLQWGDRA